MYQADFHIHCSYSGDSDTPMEEIVQQAIRMGLDEIAFTDHVDFGYADPAFESIPYDEYIPYFESLKEKYQAKIKLTLGVEMGYQTSEHARIQDFLNRYALDFVILSRHMSENKDYYTGEFFEGYDQPTAYQHYFESVLRSVQQQHNYDVFGHLDVIVRYGPFEHKKLFYADYKDIVDEILRTIIQDGHGIEVNTSGFRYGLGHMHPQVDFLKRYHELGGKIVTLGSDSHNAFDIHDHLPQMQELLKTLGFEAFATYEKRQPIFHKL